MKQIVDRIGEAWCKNMHQGVMWPIHGQYQCRKCFREYPVAFETSADRPRAHRHEGLRVVTAKAA